MVVMDCPGDSGSGERQEWPAGLNHVPSALLDLCESSADFSSRCHRIQRMFGVKEFLAISSAHGTNSGDADGACVPLCCPVVVFVGGCW